MTCGVSLMKSLPGTASIGSGLKGMLGTRITKGVINLQMPRYRKSADTIRQRNSPPSVKLSWPVETHSEIRGVCFDLVTRSPPRPNAPTPKSGRAAHGKLMVNRAREGGLLKK
jgi:hypothetical protein